MKFSCIATTASFVVVALVSNVSAAALDVFVPRITSPWAGDLWTSGGNQYVTWTWDTKPDNITNKVGHVMLRKGDTTTPLIVASNFDILAGHVSFTVPSVIEGNDYSVVLFGDSGNISPEITITGSGIKY